MLDQPLRKVAQQVLAKFGTSIILRRQVPSSYNVVTGTATPAVTSTALKARVSNYRDHDLSTTIHAGDRKVEIAAADLQFLPTIDDVIVIGGLEHAIVSVQQEMATDLPALYIVQVRR